MLDPGQVVHENQSDVAGVTQLAADQVAIEAQTVYVGGNPLAPAIHSASPMVAPPGPTNRAGGQSRRETQDHPASRTQPVPGQAVAETQSGCAGADLAGALVRLFANSLDDVEGTRIAHEARLRSLTDKPKNKNDTAKGFRHPPTERYFRELIKDTESAEKALTKKLEKAIREHPLYPWIKNGRGIGAKQGARLLAALGDPLVRQAQVMDGVLIEAERPRRGLAELWQYAGHGDPERSRLRKGWPVEHNPTVKMRTRLVADSAVQAGVRKTESCDDSNGYDVEGRFAFTPLGQVYLDARRAWAGRQDCPSCKGECSDGHKHNHALRMVGKALLADLWDTAKAQRV